jgi:ABC-type Fe3+-hydroxamate transport system substrate-binding protein
VRIVSLVPSHTETLHELGAWEDVVGVTSFCVRPETATDEKTVVGGTKSPSVDRILDLDPDLVVVAVEENPADVVDELREGGVDVLVTDPRDLDDAEEAIRDLGEATGHDAEAQAIVDRIREAREEVRRRVADRPPVRVFCPIWRDPWMVVNADTFAHAVLEAAGAVNPWAGAEDRYPEITLEEVREADVDAALLPDEPYVFDEGNRQDVLEALPLDPGRVRLLDGEALTWYGSRTPDGLRTVADTVDDVR